MNPTVIPSPVEFSISGTAAFAQAVELAKWYEGELHVAHVAGGRERRPQAEESSGDGGVDKRFSSFTDAVNTDGCRLRTVEVGGDPVTAVTGYAHLISADVLVVARHGRRSGIYWRPGVYAKALALGLPERSEFDRVIMASPETPVLQRAGCPVLLVRASARRDGSRVMTRETAAAEAVGCATGSPGAVEAIILEGRR
jgi:nucleotide-binding universal stress UspA family protein